MSRKVIAILSVLKPVDDTRNLEKIASSLGNTNKYDINIIGFSVKNIPDAQNITFYPLFDFSRLSFGRLLAPFKILQNLIKLKPELIIVTCAELLIVTCTYKIIFGAKIIYDIQENYYRNILHTPTYPWPLRHIIGSATRGIEWLSSPIIDRYILAEKVYQKQLNFIRSKNDILENKAVIPAELNQEKKINISHTTFLYTGTIASHYGIFDALRFIRKLHEANSCIVLRIVGFAPDPKVLQKLIAETADCDYIKIIGGNKLIPHNQILKEMTRADYCILPYQKNKSTEGRFPTKLFECLALEVPVIISPNPAWDDIILKNNAGITYNFNEDWIPLIEIDRGEYYGQKQSHQYLWSQEELKLQTIVEQLI